jgi:hypothetical protein
MRNAGDLFGKKRDEFADISLARYVRPRGKGLHVVELAGSGIQVILSSLAGNMTFSPDDLVTLGSRSGRRNPVILGLPPAGSLAGGAVALSVFLPDADVVPVIISAIPDEIEAGAASERVVLVGRGFFDDPLDYFEAVLWDEATADWIADPLVTVHDPEWIADPAGEGLSLETGEDAVAVLIDVDAAREVGSTISFRATRG